MKKIFFMAALVAAAFAAGAQEKLVIHAGQFTRLDIADNMKVVLTQAAPGDTLLRIENNDLTKLRINLSGNTLQIAPHSFSLNAVITVVVNDLTKLTVGEGTMVSTEGEIRATKLDMYIDDECQVNLRTNAKIKAYPIGQHEVVLRRSPIAAAAVTRTF